MSGSHLGVISTIFLLTRGPNATGQLHCHRRALVTHPNKKELIAGSRGLLHYLELALRFQRQQRTALTHSVHDRAAGASTLGTTTIWGGPSLEHSIHIQSVRSQLRIQTILIFPSLSLSILTIAASNDRCPHHHRLQNWCEV